MFVPRKPTPVKTTTTRYFVRKNGNEVKLFENCRNFIYLFNRVHLSKFGAKTKLAQ